MSSEGKVRVMTTHRLQEMKQNGEKIAMLTAYDYTFANIVNEAGIDIILVGDSAANVMAGHETTLPITIDQMIYHAQSVMRAVKNPLVVVDMPFGTYQGNSKAALNNAIRIMKESEADAVRLEGGIEIIESVEKILTCGIPVMGCGGIASASDVIEMMMAGATAVQVGAENLRNPYACKEIIEALPAEMERLGIGSLSEIIGAAHKG